MAKLPPPPGGYFPWVDYRINTPTFCLSPVEKPDMSPFLIHMTGKEQIYQILNGDNADVELPDRNGFLRASVPTGNGDYDASVVCFTESPTFVVDFFRYRKFDRWRDDQRFGIGFSKEQLVQQGVQPVLYLHNDLMQRVMEGRGANVYPGGYSEELKQLCESVYPLMFPLGEDMDIQGFMWEREWRYPKSEGFTFPLSTVKVICCPEEEEDAIRDILGEYAEAVQFVRAWDEYDDVTAYLKGKEVQWREQVRAIPQIDDVDELVALKIQHSQVVNSLENHEAIISKLKNELDTVVAEKERLKGVVDQIEERIGTCIECEATKFKAEMKVFHSGHTGGEVCACWRCYTSKAYPHDHGTCCRCGEDFSPGELRVWNDEWFPAVDVICYACYDAIMDE